MGSNEAMIDNYLDWLEQAELNEDNDKKEKEEDNVQINWRRKAICREDY